MAFYKITECRSKTIIASKTSSEILTELFMMTEKAQFDVKNLERAYRAEVSLKTAKARDILKCLSSILPTEQPYC